MSRIRWHRTRFRRTRPDNFLYVFKAGPSGPLRRPPQPKDGPISPTPAPLPSARPSAQAAPTQPDGPGYRHAKAPGIVRPGLGWPARLAGTCDEVRPRPDSDHRLRTDAARLKGASGVADAISQARPLTRTPSVRLGWVSGRGRGPSVPLTRSRQRADRPSMNTAGETSPGGRPS